MKTWQLGSLVQNLYGRFTAEHGGSEWKSYWKRTWLIHQCKLFKLHAQIRLSDVSMSCKSNRVIKLCITSWGILHFQAITLQFLIGLSTPMRRGAV